LKHLAHVFHITFLSLGGQGSYGVYEDLVFQFIDYGIDLDQEFRILVVTDFDPHGYKIQEAAKEHLQAAGIRRVTIERVYLGPEHITPGIIERFAVPYEVEKSKASTTKAACTLYNTFGALTGGICKRAGAWMQFQRNIDGTYHVPQLTDGAGGYELYRMELDNFREDVLIQLLIDALERLIDGAEYYYTAAKHVWRETIRRGAVEAAKALIQRAVRGKTQPVERDLRELRDRLQERWEELTADEQTLIEHVQEDRDSQVESIQEDIDELQERIDALRERQETLERQRWAIRETATDVVSFLLTVKRLMVPDIPAAQQLLRPADEQLMAYREAQEEAQTEPTVSRFTVEPAAIRDVVDCSPHAGTVFQRARAGAETITAELPYTDQRRVTSAAEDDLEAQQEAMTVEVPDLPSETVEDVAQRVRDADALLAQAGRTGVLPDAWQTLRTHLVDHYLHDDLGGTPGMTGRMKHGKDDDLYRQ
jgi:TolA-binding protein